MRIQLFAPDFPPKGDLFDGGLDKAVHGLASGFVNNGAQVTVLCLGEEDAAFQMPQGYHIRCFEERLTTHLGLRLPKALKHYIRGTDRSDVFLLNGVFNSDTYLVARECRRNNLVYYCWPHDPYTKSLFAKKRYLKWPYWCLRDRPMLQHAAGIQVFDEEHTRALRGLGVQTPTIEISNGMDPIDAIDASELRWNSDGVPRFIYLGRMDYYNKGLDVLLDAFSEVFPNGGATLTLQGPDNGDLGMLRDCAARLGLSSESVQFKAPDFDRSASNILNEHDVLVLPSRFEGFGLAALEAMVVGRVVMLSEISGLAKHVRAAGCGVVVTPDKDSVAGGFSQLMKDRSVWKAMGLAGRAYALDHFHWDRIAADLMQYYASGRHHHEASSIVTN